MANAVSRLAVIGGIVVTISESIGSKMESAEEKYGPLRICDAMWWICGYGVVCGGVRACVRVV